MIEFVSRSKWHEPGKLVFDVVLGLQSIRVRERMPDIFRESNAPSMTGADLHVCLGKLLPEPNQFGWFIEEGTSIQQFADEFLECIRKLGIPLLDQSSGDQDFLRLLLDKSIWLGGSEVVDSSKACILLADMGEWSRYRIIKDRLIEKWSTIPWLHDFFLSLERVA